jgi:hypothetical protein
MTTCHFFEVGFAYINPRFVALIINTRGDSNVNAKDSDTAIP